MYTSKNTSIKNNVATAIKKFPPKKSEWVIDYGCGRSPETTKKYICDNVKDFDIQGKYIPYDPNWNFTISNDMIEVIELWGVEVIYCCNVLNVIKDKSNIYAIINIIISFMSSKSKAYFQIYEGNKSGIGRQTKPDCYQRNEKTTEYINVIKEVINDKYRKEEFGIEKKGNIIILTKDSKNTFTR